MAKAYQYIEINKNKKLETDNLVELHKILLAGNPTREHIAGRLRTPETDELVQQIFKINKNAPKKVIHEYSEPKDVVKDLKNLNQYISKNNEKMDVFELAANIFSELTRIHPFLDGNGRVTRLFTEHFLLSKGYRLMKWPEETLYRKIVSPMQLAGYLKQNCVKE